MRSSSKESNALFNHISLSSMPPPGPLTRATHRKLSSEQKAKSSSFVKEHGIRTHEKENIDPPSKNIQTSFNTNLVDMLFLTEDNCSLPQKENPITNSKYNKRISNKKSKENDLRIDENKGNECNGQQHPYQSTLTSTPLSTSHSPYSVMNSNMLSSIPSLTTSDPALTSLPSHYDHYNHHNFWIPFMSPVLDSKPAPISSTTPIQSVKISSQSKKQSQSLKSSQCKSKIKTADITSNFPNDSHNLTFNHHPNSFFDTIYSTPVASQSFSFENTPVTVMASLQTVGAQSQPSTHNNFNPTAYLHHTFTPTNNLSCLPFETPLSNQFTSYLTPKSISSNSNTTEYSLPKNYLPNNSQIPEMNSSSKSNIPNQSFDNPKMTKLSLNDLNRNFASIQQVFSPPMTPGILDHPFTLNSTQHPVGLNLPSTPIQQSSITSSEQKRQTRHSKQQIPSLPPAVGNSLFSNDAVSMLHAYPLTFSSQFQGPYNKRPMSENTSQSSSTPKTPSPLIIKSFRKIIWEDKGISVYEMVIGDHIICRRADNNMLNATKLLNMTTITRGVRDSILKREKIREVVRVGPLSLKGVWLPIDRCQILSEKYNILKDIVPIFSTSPEAMVREFTKAEKKSLQAPDISEAKHSIPIPDANTGTENSKEVESNEFDEESKQNTRNGSACVQERKRTRESEVPSEESEKEKKAKSQKKTMHKRKKMKTNKESHDHEDLVTMNVTKAADMTTPSPSCRAETPMSFCSDVSWVTMISEQAMSLAGHHPHMINTQTDMTTAPIVHSHQDLINATAAAAASILMATNTNSNPTLSPTSITSVDIADLHSSFSGHEIKKHHSSSLVHGEPHRSGKIMNINGSNLDKIIMNTKPNTSEATINEPNEHAPIQNNESTHVATDGLDSVSSCPMEEMLNLSQSDPYLEF